MSEQKEIIAYAIILVIVLILAQHMNVVVSGSMEPVLYRGDIVIVEQANLLGAHEFNPNNVEVGDIVVYNANWFPNPVIHRVINVTEENGSKYFMIKGDNNPTPDPTLVSPSQITARAVKLDGKPIIIPKVGYITIWIKGL